MIDSKTTDQALWRSIEEREDPDGFARRQREMAARYQQALAGAVDRRQFLQLMGASIALAGLTGCTQQPKEEIVPYVRQPEQFVPGRPLFFATTLELGGFAVPVLAESHQGRPTKLEGNPESRASGGATDAFTQAEVLSLYDPDRSQVVLHGREIRPWGAFVAALRGTLEAQKEASGAGLRILTRTVTSPSLAAQIRALLGALPQARWHQWEPVNRDARYAGARLAFGDTVETVYELEKADVIVSLGSDFLGSGPAHLRHVAQFSARRRVNPTRPTMSRLYAFETTPTNTGAMADHRWPVAADQLADVARAIGARLGIAGASADGTAFPWLDALVRDLELHRRHALVIAGDEQPAHVHAWAHAINHALECVGETVRYTEPVVAVPDDQGESLRELVADMTSGTVSTLLILDGNPVYDAPADVPFAAALARVGLSVHLGLYDDETAELCHWHVPAAHALEAWGDARAFDGSVSLRQPLIEPLYSGKTPQEILALLGDTPDRSAHDLLRAYWREHLPGDFERAWRKALHDGIVPGTEALPRSVTMRTDHLSRGSGDAKKEGLEILFRADPTVFDGRFANNGWLQELPKPLTRLTWDNAAMVAPALARRLGLENGDVVELRYRGRSVEAPAWILPGQAAESVTVHLGYGRTRAGRVGTGAGFNAYLLRTATQSWSDRGLEIRKTGRTYDLSVTQEHQSMEGRDLIRQIALKEVGHAAKHEAHAEEMTLYPPDHTYPDYAWGMTIDLNACTGCNACVTACQAENNIPIVGKEEVSRGHEMLWLRVDRYFGGDEANPQVLHQPVPCMHCENAPCEVVCPVGATVHSSEGLNDMVYNRCVGTKYCSNNCPYKVRRFNWFKYSEWESESLKMLYNPDVTVRSRGVMEKCTYCVQRINHARIESQREGRPIRDGEVRTACQQVCPAEAIAFGNLNDADSRVARAKRDPRHYALLGELNTRPRTTYLARVRNQNEQLKG